MSSLPLLLPQPARMVPSEGEWVRTHHAATVPLRISAAPMDSLSAQVALLAHYLETENHFAAEPGSTDGGDIHLALTLPARPSPARLREAGFDDEAHRITITPEQILIEAASSDGVARGIQTLRQLLSGQRARLRLAGMIITDAPELGWRGLLLDVSRHFRDADEVKRFIDLAAYHKFNLLHWHLTDDQGWRLPIEGYPRLTEVAAWRDGTMVGFCTDKDQEFPIRPERHGGAYTPEEIRDIVSHATARGVRILPEVDVPGHVQSLVTAYPELGNTGRPPGVRQKWGISSSTLNLEPATFAFLEKVVDTLTGLFPFHYLHFGGDEALIDEWTASETIQRRKRELGLATDRDVQGYFTTRLHDLARARGRAIIGWDEIIEHNEPPVGTAVMFWRDASLNSLRLDIKALRTGMPLVLAPQARTYFDHKQAVGDLEPLAFEAAPPLPIEDVYAWRPLADYPTDLRDGVLGAQAQLWTEYIPTARHLDYMAYPRACALAQVLWTGEAREEWPDFNRRLDTHLARLDRLGVAYRPRD